jgi:hypothetical protein
METKYLLIFFGMFMLVILWASAFEQFGFVIGLGINTIIMILWIALEIEERRTSKT